MNNQSYELTDDVIGDLNRYANSNQVISDLLRETFISISKEMTEPDVFELMILRKQHDRKDFKFAEDIEFILAPEREERRTTFDNKHYKPIYTGEIGWDN